MYRENYKLASGAQIAIASVGCMLGGAAVTALGFCGAFGGYESLEKMGYGLQTIPCYGIVVLCGLLIMLRVEYAISAAIAACAVEFAIYVGMGVMGTSSIDMSFLVMLKLAVVICCTQLLVTVKSDSLEDVPKNVEYVLPEGAPQAHQRQVYQEMPQNMDNAAVRQGCGVARNSMYGMSGVPQPRRSVAHAPGIPQSRRSVAHAPGVQPPQPRNR